MSAYPPRPHGGGYWSGGVWIGGGCFDCYDPLYYPRYPYPYYPPDPYRYRYHYDDSAAVRVQVQPDQTRVYVDGYYAGIADDFDGNIGAFAAGEFRHGPRSVGLFWVDGRRGAQFLRKREPSIIEVDRDHIARTGGSQRLDYQQANHAPADNDRSLAGLNPQTCNGMNGD